MRLFCLLFLTPCRAKRKVLLEVLNVARKPENDTGKKKVLIAPKGLSPLNRRIKMPSGKRVKKPQDFTDPIHLLLKRPDFFVQFAYFPLMAGRTSDPNFHFAPHPTHPHHPSKKNRAVGRGGRQTGFDRGRGGGGTPSRDADTTKEFFFSVVMWPILLPGMKEAKGGAKQKKLWKGIKRDWEFGTHVTLVFQKTRNGWCGIGNVFWCTARNWRFPEVQTCQWGEKQDLDREGGRGRSRDKWRGGKEKKMTKSEMLW